jgi:hypothetical protein
LLVLCPKCCHYLLNLLWREKGLPHSSKRNSSYIELGVQ